ncbi:MAG: hypothetical protein U0892_15600 [Pirellulales bacterium]
MDKVSEYLQHLGLSRDKLTAAEQKTLSEWQTALSAKDVTIADLKSYLTGLVKKLHTEQNDYNNDPAKDLFLKAQIRNADFILAFINGPEAQRQWASEQIDQRIKQN